MVEVAPAVEMTTDNIGDIARDGSGQELAEICITEAEARLLSDDGDLCLDLSRHLEWERGYEVEMVDGDLELGTASRANDNQWLRIPVDAESDEASNIKVTGTLNVYRGTIRGESEVELAAESDAVVDDNL